MISITSRRALLGGAGMVGFGLIAPAIAAGPSSDRHGAWLAQRGRMLEYANSVDCESKAFDHACIALSRLERLIMHTPAANVTEAQAKLRFTADLDAEGSMLTAEDAAELLADIAPILAGGR